MAGQSVVFIFLLIVHVPNQNFIDSGWSCFMSQISYAPEQGGDISERISSCLYGSLGVQGLLSGNNATPSP